MSTKTKFIFLMSFLALVIVGCVASMVIVLAAPKQKGILDVSIKYVGGLHKEREMFNGRYYYYYEMGEYPQTYAGAATSVTGLTETQEKFVCDVSTPSSALETVIEENKQYNIWVDESENCYIKHTINPSGTNANYAYMNGVVPVVDEIAFFKIEPIKWDVVGYYNGDKTDFTRASDGDFDPQIVTNLVVTSRTALQAMPWFANSYTTDIDYYMSETKYSTVWHWLRTFEDNVIDKLKDVKVTKLMNQYMDSSANSSLVGTFMSGSVEEYAWIMDYNQANIFFSSDTERRCAPSDFALATYACQYLDATSANMVKNASSYSWLRSSYCENGDYRAGIVNKDGALSYNNVVASNSCPVRPCLLINL